MGTNQTVSSSLAEDCLFINVFAPSHATPKSKLKVWFYIQGGGYSTNSNANYNGTDVVSKSDFNVILVNFNYRVGALGFLAGEDVREDGALNAGLLDQRKALEWVQKYVHLFGGDPDHVVIHGASAGGGSVSFQMAAYGGRDDGLFVGAMPESPFWPTHRTVGQSEFQYTRFMNEIGCGDAYDKLACGRTKSITTIQAANVNSPFPGTTGDPRWYFLPVVDGDFSRSYLYTAFLEGKFVRVPTLVADDTDEGTYFVPNATSSSEVEAFFKDNYPNLNKQQLDEIIDLYPVQPPRPLHAAWFGPAADAYGDGTFTCPGLTISDTVSQYVSREESWNYRYNVLDPTLEAEGLGVPHTIETPAIFGLGDTGTVAATSLETTNAPIVPIVMDYYLSFVQTLNPNPLKSKTAPYWHSYGESHQRLKIQTNDTMMENIPEVQQERCKLWEDLYKTMQV